ncbi:MAG TPA: rod shape-determining protein [Methylomirabilota bacterium]|nr:rod shape-determining protein [Methylomirabilota bacterium]
MSEVNGTLCVGIDLGTSRSSISASNGARYVIESYVGWPVDMVARKVVKKSVLIGQEAVENRPMLDLRRPLERGVIKEGSERDEAAVREILRHLVSLARAHAKEKEQTPVRAVVGVPSEAFRASKQRLREVMKGIVNSLLIVSEPFAVAYGIEELLHAMIIDLGAGTTDFCVMNGRYPTDEDQRTLTSAGDAIDEQLMKLVQNRYPEAQFSIHMVREWKEKWSFVGEPQQRVLVTVPVAGKPTPIDITEQMRSACESILPPVTETMLDLLSHVEPEYQEKVRNNIILSGGSSLIRGLAEALQHSLADVGGGRVRTVEDPVFAGSNGGLALAIDADEADWEQLTT